MARRVVILGGGTGGTLVANRLRRLLPPQFEIVVIDADDRHLYQPGLLFVPFGLTTASSLVRSRRAQLRSGIEFLEARVEQVDLATDKVVLAAREPVFYDVLVVASGSRLLFSETEGLVGPGWGEKVHTFYDAAGARALAASLADFEGGRLVVSLIDLPVKCPVAPLEFCFLADWYLRQKKIRQRVEITYVTSLDGAFTKAVCNRELSGLLSEKGVEVVTEFATGEVDGAKGRLTSYDGREIDFDLAVMVPLHGGASYVEASPGLGDPLGFVPTAPTLQAKEKANVFVVGDATDLRASKAGSVAHFEGEILAANVASYLSSSSPRQLFDGHTNCFIETGFEKAILIDFNDELEPLPGHFPGRIGLPLLKESRLNHLGKLAFQQLYWHAILPGRDIPFVSAAMPRAGKRLGSLASKAA
jgi:sulfide:quinone oxidoreductase